MWDKSIAYPFGLSPKRNIFMFLSATFVAIFACIIAIAPTSHAAPANADWTTEAPYAIRYDGREFTKATKPFGGDAKSLSVNKSYTYTVPQGSSSTEPKEVRVIYFDSAAADPLKATTANYAVYAFTPPNTYTLTSAATILSVTPQGTTPSNSGTSSCHDTGFLEGIGWVICPVTNNLAKAMDSLFNILVGFLTVRPVQTGQDNALYRAWSMMRNFANIAFVIAFVIIIYSQLTSVGLSNYGIKRLLPRIIIAAILVNISYWICAIAVDISNISGESVQSVFIGIRNSLVGTEGNTWDTSGVNWTDMTTLIFGGGAGAAGIVWLNSVIATTGGGILAASALTSAFWLLFPLLIGAIIAVFIALLVMAARQAIITILIVIAPLAFVAYLLPNTEKYFERWRETFTTLLVMFPIVSFLFGGSQVAGAIIIQNADSISTVLFGMAVQVAPVVVTPMLVKFSGSIVGRIAGIANNPGKGLIDRSRKMSDERLGLIRARNLAKDKKGFGPQSWARRKDHKRRDREGNLKKYEAIGDNKWHETDAYKALHLAEDQANTEKQRIEAVNNKHLEDKIRRNPEFAKARLEMQVAIDKASLAKAKMEAMSEEFKAGHYTGPGGRDEYGRLNPALASLMNESEYTNLDNTMTGRRKSFAEDEQRSRVLQSQLANTAMIDGYTVREYGGGIRGQEGADTILASSIAEDRKEFNNRVGEKTALIAHFNPDSKLKQNLANGQNIDIRENPDDSTSRILYTFKGNDIYAVDAAIEDKLTTGSFDDIEEIITQSGIQPNGTKGRTYEHRTTISQAITKNGIPNKAVFFGSKAINDIAQGKVSGGTLDNYVVYNIMEGKVKDDVLAGMDAKAIERMFRVADTYRDPDPAKQAKFAENAKALHYSAYRIQHTPLLTGKASQSAIKVLGGKAEEPPPNP